MAPPNSRTIHFTPKGLSDAFDGSQVFPGACRKLVNLVFDQSNPEIVIARPGVGAAITSFAGFTTPGFVSCQITLGDYVYGMLATGLTTAHDEPFCYQISTSAFIPVHNVSAGNVEGRPTSPATTGEWTPPSMAVVGSEIVITHPGYTGLPQACSFTGGTGGVASATLTVSAVASGQIVLGMNVTGAGIAANTYIAGYGTGTGGLGTYILNQSATVTAGTSLTGASGNFYGVINIADLANPIYCSTNTAQYPLPSVPTFAANLNNRAYFACKNQAYYSDALIPISMSNAGQALTIGDNTAITGMSGLPVQTTTAGVISALLVFKATSIWQITGDAVVSGSLSLNFLTLTMGTDAPRSIVSTTLGTIFAGADGPYVVNPYGAVVPVSPGLNGMPPDIRLPFSNVTTPTRAAAAFAGSVYRICLLTIVDGVSGTYDYWFDLRRMRWNGPHTFPYDGISSAGIYFILSGAGSGAALFKSTVFPSNASNYLDNGSTTTVDFKSCTFPKDGGMVMHSMIESNIELSSIGNAQTYSVAALDNENNQMSSANITLAKIGGVWGSNVWGDGTLWAAASNAPSTYGVQWMQPLVYNKMAIEVITQSAANVSIGTFMGTQQNLGYISQGFFQSTTGAAGVDGGGGTGSGAL